MKFNDMKRVIIPIENYELDDYKVHKDGMKDYDIFNSF